MRALALMVLAFLANGCTIHVVEQAASPARLADVPPPAPVCSRPTRPVVARAPAPVVASRSPASPTLVAPRVALRPEVARPTPRPSRIPFKGLAPEARSGNLASGATKRHRPEKVKLDEPATRFASTRVAKAQ